MKRLLIPWVVFILAVLPLLAQNLGGKGVAGGKGVFGGGGSAPVSRNFTLVNTVQGTPTSNGISAVTISETTGHLYYVMTGAGLAAGNTSTSFACTDGTNTYTKVSGVNVPNGFITFPSPTDQGNGGAAYLLSSPTTASRTITCTWTASGGAYAFSFSQAEDWSYTGTGLAFDKAAGYWAQAIGGNPSGLSPILSPCIQPAQVGSLLIGWLGTDLGVFTASAAPFTYNATDQSAWDASSAVGVTCPSFTDNSSPDTFLNIIASFH